MKQKQTKEQRLRLSLAYTHLTEKRGINMYTRKFLTPPTFGRWKKLYFKSNQINWWYDVDGGVYTYINV